MKKYLLAYLPIIFLAKIAVAGEIEEESPGRSLEDFSLQELLEVEVSLDADYDVFAGVAGPQAVSLASKKKEDQTIAPSVTSVITRQDIEAMGATSLEEALQSIPGLHVGWYSEYVPAISIRGIDNVSGEVLLLVNGVPFQSLIGGRQRFWTGLPVANISRIEVVRGPGSALYGADAFAGVINVITKHAGEINGAELGGRAGSYDTYDGWLLLSGSQGDIDIAASLQYRDTKGFDPYITADYQSWLDATFSTEASLAPGRANLAYRRLDTAVDLSSAHWNLQLGYYGVDDRGRGVHAMVLDTDGEAETSRFNIDFTYRDNELFGPYWDSMFKVSAVDFRSSVDGLLYPAGAWILDPYPEGVLNKQSAIERQYRSEIQTAYHGFKGHDLQVGVGYDHQELIEVKHVVNMRVGADGIPVALGSAIDVSDTEEAAYPEKSRHNRYIYLQDNWQFAEGWSLTAGLRHDHYSEFGGVTNPRFALIWQPLNNLTTKLLYGEAFRTPTFMQLYVKNLLGLRGNPDLQPEKIKWQEWVLNYRPTDNFNSTLNFYHFDIEDKIRFVADPNNPLVFVTANASQQHGLGMEWEGRWKINQRSSLILNYSYGINEQEDEDVGHYPRTMAFVRHDWLVAEGWFIDTRINWVGEQQRVEADDLRDSADSYTSVDLTLRYKPQGQQGWNIALGLRNIFDEDIRDPVIGQIPDDLPQPGFNAFLEAAYHF